MSTKKRHAEISSGGFAGLTTATALAQRGWSVRVHERREKLQEEGAGIVLWQNSLKVLDALGVTEILNSGSMTPNSYDTDAVATQWREIASRSNRDTDHTEMYRLIGAGVPEGRGARS